MKEPSDLVLGICNAYEQGYGHGYDQRNLSNPWLVGSEENEAWDYGYSEGSNKRVRHEDNKRAKTMGIIS